MLKDVKFGFIGSGAMATAMIAGLSKQGLIDPDKGHPSWRGFC